MPFFPVFPLQKSFCVMITRCPAYHSTASGRRRENILSVPALWENFRIWFGSPHMI